MARCIICGAAIKAQCRCPRGDTMCMNGHSYHYSHYHKEYHLGKADHSVDIMSPDCCKDKIVVGNVPINNFERLKTLKDEYEMADVIMYFLSTHYSEVIMKDGTISGLPLLKWLQAKPAKQKE
jgi:hypothetical protein